MNHPTPQEAIDILDRATSMLNVTRADHVAIQQAIMVLRQFIMEKSKPLELVTEAANG